MLEKTEITQKLDKDKVLEELNYQMQLIKTITDNTASALFMMDANGYPTFMNPAAEKLTGYKLEEIRDKPLHYAIHYKYPDGRPYPMEECPLDNSSATLTSVQNQEEVFVDKYGRLFPVVWSLSPLEKNGVTVGAVIEFRDVTLEKKAEQERLHAFKQAEEQERRRADAEGKRAEALAEIDKAKTLFFSNISHEFRTPLTLMLGPLEDSLADENNPLLPLQRARQELIHRNALRLLKLVNSLLDFSRIEANRIQAIYEPTDLAKLTVDLASCFESAMNSAQIKYIMDISAIGEPIYIDKEIWEKIIFNLLSNAFKFTLRGEIKVSLKKVEDKVQLRVQDTGVGIPANELPRLFERFHRIEGSRGRSFEGTGIGLALVKELVKLHGGNIEVESLENIGTTFTVSIPLGCAHLPEEHLGRKRENYKPTVIGRAYVEEASHWLPKEKDQTEINEPEKTISSADTKEHRVLLADDSTDMRTYVRELLSEYWQVDEVDNGESALEAALNDPPDLILSDVMMPRMNGFELVQKLRASPKTKLIPCILLSARAGEDARIEGLNAGADDYLIKPFSGKELIAKVKTQLELGGMRVKLEQMVRQRTQELEAANELLQQKILEKLSAEVKVAEQQATLRVAEEYRSRQDEFINTICHEIRNPLNVIYGATSLLQDRIFSLESVFRRETDKLGILTSEEINQILKKVKEDLTSLEYCSKQQKIIVDDVLDLSKLESNKIELNPVSINVKSLLSNIAKMFNPQLEQKNLKLMLDVQDNDIYIKVDAHRLSQIITNLLSNAIKFTDEGFITISMMSRLIDEDKLELKITVQDTGRGMTKEEVSHLFQQFKQVHHQVTSMYSGSGLGLVISKKLIEIMGGTIEVKSEKWKGSNFSFTVKGQSLTENEKLEYIKDRTEQPFKESRKRCNEDLNELAKKTASLNILIVEDNKMNQRILANFLEAKGYFYQTADNGLEALEKCKNYEFDLILMDIEMPIMNGLTATRQLRDKEKVSTNKHTPIIGLSGYAKEEQIAMAKQAGFDDYITKPVRREEFYKIIKLYTGENPPLLKKLKLPDEEPEPRFSTYAHFSLLTQRDAVNKSFDMNRSAKNTLYIPTARHSCFNEEDNQLKQAVKCELPAYLDFGEAIGKNESFFDVVAQCLNELEGVTSYDYQALRILCDEYIKSGNHSWVKTAVEKEGGNYEQYLARVRFTAEEMERFENENILMGTAERGKPHIEGRILCEVLNISLHVIEIRKATEKSPLLITHQMINAIGSQSIESGSIDYRQPRLIHMVFYNNHYIPILPSVPNNTLKKMPKKTGIEAQEPTIASCPMITIDSNYKIISLNESAKREFFRVFGRDLSEGMNLVEITMHAPEQQAKALAILARALAGESAIQKVEFIDIHQVKHTYEAKFGPLHDTEGHVIGAMCSSQEYMDLDREAEARIGQERKIIY